MDEKICLDSDIIISLLRGDVSLSQKISLVNSRLCTTSINVFEVWYGKKVNETTEQILNTLDTFIFDNSAAKLSAEILLKLEKEGNPLEFRDIFVASICIANRCQLWTNNKKHFERMEQFGLRLVK